MKISNKVKKFLIIGIFILSFVWAGTSLAIGTPTGLNPCPGADVPLSLLLDWNDVPGAHHYELYYKRVEATDWTDRYPSISQHLVTGLSPEKEYHWFVVSCGDADCIDKAASAVCYFATQALPPPENGNGNGWPGVPIDLMNPLHCQDLECVLNALINFLFYLVMALAPILIIWAAVLISTAAGKVEQVNKGKTIIFWTMIALVIALLAKGLPSIIKGVFGG